MPSNGQDALTRQLYDADVAFSTFWFNIYLLWALIILVKLGMELQFTFTLLRLKTLLNLCVFGKCLSNSNKNFLPILVATLQLYERLNHTIFRPLFLLGLRSLFSVSSWNVIIWSNPLLERVFLNNFLEFLRTVLSDDALFIRREIFSGRFFIMWDGWLEFTLMYNGFISGLLFGLYLPVDRFSVKSRKSTTLRFVSLTMLN